MGEEIELPTCIGWNCNASVYFLEESCSHCGTYQNWGQFLEIECPDCGMVVDSSQWACYCGTKLNRWVSIIQEVLAHPAHTDLSVAKKPVDHPLEWEFKEGGGKPVGQNANYRVALPDGKGIHVKEYDDHYKIHWDKVAPSQNGLGHLLSDAPAETLLVSGLLYLFFKGGGP